MALEIERKWLVNAAELPFDLSMAQHYHIHQSYVSFHPQIRLRNINHGQSYLLTIKTGNKSAEDSLAREEFEAVITPESYEDLLTQTQGKSLVKTRYLVPHSNGHIFEVDIYEGEYAGLAVVEMEFSSEEEALAFPNPSWALEDISTNPLYKNVVMAQS